MSWSFPALLQGGSAMTVPKYKFLEVENVIDVVVVSFKFKNISGEDEIRSLGQELFDLIDRGLVKIVIDFSNVERISSSIIGKLVAFNKKSGERRGRVVICGMNKEIYEYLEILKLKPLFIIAKNSQEAIYAF